MFEGLRQQITHRRTSRDFERREKALTEDERRRQASLVRTKLLRQRKAAEEELREQTQHEITELENTRRALRERKLAERELRALKPNPARKFLSSVARAPLRIAKAGTTAKGSKRLHGLIFAPPSFFATSESKSTSSKPKQSSHDFIFGKPGDWMK